MVAMGESGLLVMASVGRPWAVGGFQHGQEVGGFARLGDPDHERTVEVRWTVGEGEQGRRGEGDVEMIARSPEILGVAGGVV